jgi:pimeloyl-ACP methyl ester carboxylesterase
VYYKAMVAEWARSGAAAGIVEEMLLCGEAGPGRGLGFRYADVAGGVPVRVVLGSEDGLVSEAAVRAWAEAASGSGGGGGGGVEVTIVPGATHDGVVHTHKAQVLEALAEGLKGGGGGGGKGGGRRR